MAYDLVLYYNTGFDSVNIPDRPTLLTLATTKTYPALQVVQDSFLSTVRIKATYEEVLGADYAKVGAFYYSVEAYKMLSVSTCELSLLLDAFTSGGGIPSMTLESGWLTRAHEKKSEDIRANVLPEPFTPQEPLQLEYLGHIGESPEGGTLTVIQSTINLGHLSKEGTLEALQFRVPDATGDSDCVIPRLARIEIDTVVKMPLLTTEDSFKLYTTALPGATLYEVRRTDRDEGTFAHIRRGLNNARSVGVESAVTAQYNLPLQYLDEERIVIADQVNYQILDLVAKTESLTLERSGDFVPDPAAYSQKEYIGPMNSYIVCSTCSGSKVEANPEDIYEVGATAPTLYLTSDLRSSGKPYLYFRAYLGYLNTTLQSVCEGLTWQNEPLVYTDKSGGALDTYNFMSSRYLGDFSRNIQVGSQLFNTVSSMAGAFVGSAGGQNIAQGVQYNLLGATTSADWMNAGAASLRAGASQAGGWLNTVASGETYRASRNKDLFNFTAAQSLVVPEVNFPRAEGLRDFLGNGFFIFRRKLSPRDAMRFRQFLTMYGNHVSKPATKADFTNKKNFNFIQSDDIHLKFPGFSKVLNSLANSQVRAGVRLWHVLPDTAFYSDNPDIEEVV